MAQVEPIDKVAAIQVFREAVMATPHTALGAVRWFGYKGRDIYLATVGHGRRYVMRFARMGMNSAQPEFQVYRKGETNSGIMHKAVDLAKTKSYDGTILDLPHPDANLIEVAFSHGRAVLDHIDTQAATIDHLAQVIRENAQKVHQGYHTDSKGTWEDCAKDSCMSASIALRNAVLVIPTVR